MNGLKVAAVQTSPVFGEVRANVDAALALVPAGVTDTSERSAFLVVADLGEPVAALRVAAAAAELFPPEHVELKDPKDWEIIGKPVKRLDTDDKLNGKQVYGADLTLPNMLNAAIRACPVFGGTLKSFDDAEMLGKAPVGDRDPARLPGRQTDRLSRR